MSKPCPGTDKTLMQAAPQADRLFACDCCQRTAPVWEACFPGDACLEQALETARRYAKGLASGAELREARSALGKTQAVILPQVGLGAWYSYQAAAKLLSDDLTPQLRNEIAQECAMAVAVSNLPNILCSDLNDGECQAALEKERQWQKARLGQYSLQGV